MEWKSVSNNGLRDNDLWFTDPKIGVINSSQKNTDYQQESLTVQACTVFKLKSGKPAGTFGPFDLKLWSIELNMYKSSAYNV